MKHLCFLAALMAGLLGQSAGAQTDATGTGKAIVAKTATNNVDFSAELTAVTQELKTKFDQGKTNAVEMQASLTNINALILKHIQDGKKEQVARLYLLDAHIYADALGDKDKAEAIWSQVIRNFPGTVAAQGAAISIATLYKDVPEGLEVGQRFPDFAATDVFGHALSVSAYRGHVTMVDFWATWCGPCRAEMPNVIATYQQYHPQGFEIIGVSLDEDQNQLVNFIRSAGMAWPQYFDGQNKLAGKYDIQSIPMSYLLDRHGVIIDKGLRGSELGETVAKSLAGH